MKFHYEFDIKKPPFSIEHYHKLFLIGSCFTENIGEKLRKCKFTLLENPNGILFNPVSVTEAIISYIEKKIYSENNLFQFNESWHSWKHHSRFSDLNPQDALDKINSAFFKAHRFLGDADFLFITLGSAWVYELNELALGGMAKSVAANNHKAPSEWFNRRLLNPEEVLSCIDNMIHRLFIFNPNIKVIFTISPVRHLREGVVENNRSKAVLIHTVHQLIDKFDNLYYFPAYELVIDDLRDYRFYAEDLVHPNYSATQYVWEKLIQACMNQDTRKLMEELDVINRAMNHKPINAGSNQHKRFMRSFFDKIGLLQRQYPKIDLSQEITYFSQPENS